MSLFEQKSHYQILELTPDASAHEIREAYQRLKHAYSKDSVAMYSLLSEEECQSVLESIEKAYAVLSSEAARREYDRDFDSSFRSFERAEASPEPGAAPAKSGGGFFGDADLLTAPTTSLSDSHVEPPRSDFFGATSPAPAPAADAQRPIAERQVQHATTHAPIERSVPAPAPKAKTTHREFAPDTEWSGALFRSVRDEAGIPIEEMVAQTRISKTYLRAIEDEEYAKLPAVVFTRGFVTQVVRILKLPAEAVPGYIGRLERAKSAK